MKTITRVSTMLFVAGMAASTLSFGQVKIGTNPTTIGANNNLEVEGSTAGRKTSIDKATGKVTIKDGTEGAGKVFTSDANGGGSWQSNTLTGKTIRSNVAQTFYNGVDTPLATDSPLTITNPGNYLVSVRWWGSSTQVTGGLTSAYFVLHKNGVAVDYIEYYVTGAVVNGAFSFTLNLFAPDCIANDVLTISVKAATPTPSANWVTGVSGLNPYWLPSLIVTKL